MSARTIVSSADPRTTFTELLDPSCLDLSVVRNVRNIKYRGAAARIHLALAALPEFTALAGDEHPAALEGAIRLLDQPVSDLGRGDIGETADLRSVSAVERTR